MLSLKFIDLASSGPALLPTLPSARMVGSWLPCLHFYVGPGDLNSGPHADALYPLDHLSTPVMFVFHLLLLGLMAHGFIWCLKIS